MMADYCKQYMVARRRLHDAVDLLGGSSVRDRAKLTRRLARMSYLYRPRSFRQPCFHPTPRRFAVRRRG